MEQIKDVTKRRDNEIVIHYIDDDGNYQSLRAYPGDIIAWHHAAQAATIQRLREALEPFVNALPDHEQFANSEYVDDFDNITVGDLRRAARALEEVTG